MNNAIFNLERPQNEHTLTYAPGCKERKSLNAELDRLSSEVQDIPLIIGGKRGPHRQNRESRDAARSSACAGHLSHGG